MLGCTEVLSHPNNDTFVMVKVLSFPLLKMHLLCLYPLLHQPSLLHCFLIGILFKVFNRKISISLLISVQQTHQRNQLKDTIGDADEPEGTLSFFKVLFLVSKGIILTDNCNYLELGDPLTVEEQEEKEQLLEEVLPLLDY